MNKKSILISLLIIVATAGILFTQEEKIRIAMTPFDDSVTSEGEREQAGSAAGNSIRNAFLAVDRFFVREPDAVKEYIKGLVKVQAGLAHPDLLKGQSGNLNVKYLTVGTVSKFEGIYDVDARTVNIDTWVILHSHGSTADSITEAVGDIDWSIKNQFTREYLKNRNEDDLDRPVLTVAKFTDFNIQAQKKGYSGAFSEILNSQLGSFILISTVERKYAKALLEEKMLEMAGIVSDDDSGEKLKIKGIQNKLTGDIRIFNDLICINYRLHNTSDGSIMYMGSKEIGSRNGLRSAAWSISNEIEDVLKKRIGSLNIMSTPSSAEVYIDGNMTGKTPLVISMASGNHSLMLKLVEYNLYEETVTVTSKNVTEKNITLKTAGECVSGNCQNGRGTLILPDGRKYVGEFKDGKANGQGTAILPDGRKYVGEFKDGKANGQGTATWPDGRKYVGEFKDNKRHGQGTETSPDGRKYVGEFKDGKPHGQGTSILPDGRKYVGEFKDGKANGQGTAILPDGRKYVGEFKDNKRHGQGTETSHDGSVISRGRWNNGEFVGE